MHARMMGALLVLYTGEDSRDETFLSTCHHAHWAQGFGFVVLTGGLGEGSAPIPGAVAGPAEFGGSSHTRRIKT